MRSVSYTVFTSVKQLPTRKNNLMRLLRAMSYVQNSWSVCKYASSSWTLYWLSSGSAKLFVSRAARVLYDFEIHGAKSPQKTSVFEFINSSTMMYECKYYLDEQYMHLCVHSVCSLMACCQLLLCCSCW